MGKKGNPTLKYRRTKQTNNKTYEMKRKLRSVLKNSNPHSETFHSKIDGSD
jgi:hypothetical protein